jgi:hypothetical protein
LTSSVTLSAGPFQPRRSVAQRALGRTLRAEAVDLHRRDAGAEVEAAAQGEATPTRNWCRPKLPTSPSSSNSARRAGALIRLMTPPELLP